jgi:hypothetical protein
MKKILICLLTSFIILAGCKKTYELPVLTPPSPATAEVNKAVDITFQFTAEAGFASATVTATGGTAVVKTNPAAGATTGAVVVTFTAGGTIGAGAVTLILKDAEGQSESAVAVLSLFEKGAPAITAPSNTDVEVLKTVDISFSFTSEGGYKSAAVTATGGTATVKTAPSSGATTGSVVVTFSASRTIGAGSVILTVTDNNNKPGQATGILNVKSRPTISVTQNISSDVKWETGKIYILEGRIAVLDGATLTIEPGVVIKGREGTGSNATALLVARGGKLHAEGTASSPIIFTTVADQILPGEIASPNLEPTVPGLWGGLLILGKAPISASSNEMQIEGIPVSDLNGRYGGTDPLDNSGIIKYISIRHGGANIGEGNEINGLTLGGVGSGTVIENVEVVANDDDGIEWFGGTVNVKNALVWNPYDDGIDTDQSWAGTLDNFIVICGPATDHALEIDGPEGTMLAAHTVKNGSVKGSLVAELADFRDGARGSFENIYFFNFPDPLPNNNGRGDLSLSGDVTLANFAAGILSFSNLQVTPAAGVALTTIFRNGTHVHATEVTPATRTVGADKSAFQGWTWASAANQLIDF